jgi:signal transduction histidine kinase
MDNIQLSYLDTIYNGVIIVDKDLNVVFWNKWLEFKTYIKREEIIGKSLVDRFDNLDEDELKRKVKFVINFKKQSFYTVEPHKYLISIKLNNITSRAFEIMRQNIILAPFNYENSEKNYVTIHIYDVTELEATKIKLQESLDEINIQNTYINSILQASDEIQLILNKNETIIDYSNKAQKIFKNIKKDISIKEFLSSNNNNNNSEKETLNMFITDIQAGTSIMRNAYLINFRDKDYKVQHKSISDDNSMIIFYDVTELKQQQKTLTNQSRLAAMGEMIANISHQWKQPLASLSIMLQKLYYMPVTTQEENNKLVDKTLTQINYLSDTIEDFRTFFEEEKECVDFIIEDAIRSAMSIIGKTLENKQINVNIIKKNNYILHGKQNTFAQVIINILNNAKDSLVSNNIRDKNIIIKYGTRGSLNYIEISDNGGGIPKDILLKVFEPYFTTKFKDQGTGIGLYMSKMIIENQMGGKLIAANKDDGAFFIIEFRSR